MQAKTYTTHLTPKLSHLSSQRGAPRGVRFGGPADCSLARGPFPPHVSACRFAARRDRSYPFVAVRSVLPDLRNAPNISVLWASVAKRHGETCGVRPTTARAPPNHIMGEIGKNAFYFVVLQPRQIQGNQAHRRNRVGASFSTHSTACPNLFRLQNAK